MGRLHQAPLTQGSPFLLACLAILLSALPGFADSIFDSWGLGRDMIPTAGATRALGGAVVASPDPLTASILNPCAAAKAKSLTVTSGFVQASTSTDNFGDAEKTVGSVFPSIGVVIPFAQFSLLTGLYVEKTGSVSFAETDTLPAVQPCWAGTTYQASYKRETSVHSVPILISRGLGSRVILAAGAVFSFCDMREETALNFLTSGYVDTDDILDAQTMGEGLLAALIVDLGKLSLGALYRSGPDLDGSIEKKGKFAGVWQRDDITLASHEAVKLGVLARPLPWVSLEVDYDRCPWSRLALDGGALSDKRVERWALGLQYTGNRIWPASRYPLSFGYYRQPIDWQDAGHGSLVTGEIVEEVYSAGLSLPLVEGKAAMTLAFEGGTTAASLRTNLDERFYRFSLSVSAMEIWQRSIKR